MGCYELEDKILQSLALWGLARYDCRSLIYQMQAPDQRQPLEPTHSPTSVRQRTHVERIAQTLSLNLWVLSSFRPYRYLQHHPILMLAQPDQTDAEGVFSRNAVRVAHFPRKVSDPRPVRTTKGKTDERCTFH